MILSNSIYNRGMTVSEFRGAPGPKYLNIIRGEEATCREPRRFSSELPDERILECQIGIDSARNGTLTSPPPDSNPNPKALGALPSCIGQAAIPTSPR